MTIPSISTRLANSITRHLATLDWEPEVVLASFHGIPQSYFDKGDPYYCQCQKTARLLREKLGWPKEKLQVTFQSRFGPEEWLQPYTDKTVEKLGTGRRQAHRRHQSRLCLRLPGDAGGNRRTGGRELPSQRRREVHPYPLSQRQRGRHDRAGACRAPRVAGLGVGTISPRRRARPTGATREKNNPLPWAEMSATLTEG